MPKKLIPSGYKKLLADISRLYEAMRKNVVVTYWKIGQRIVEVEQDGEVRAAYGEGLLEDLSQDLSQKYSVGVSVPNLQNMRRFYLTHKKYQTSTKLTWSQYVELLPVSDNKKRAALEARAAKKHIPSRVLRRMVRGRPANFAPKPPPKPSKPGRPLPPLKRPAVLTLDMYKKLDPAADGAPTGRKIVDCGFFVDRFIPEKSAAKLNTSDRPAYTYRAAVERVVDGDTLKVSISLGFATRVREKLRLRGINALELKTPEGQAAKRYVEKILPPGTMLVIKSSRNDPHGRFVADVFYLAGETRPEKIIAQGTYLNQELLDKGLAVRMKE